MKYLIITKDGNGYHCGCCRNEWESHDTMEFDSDEELKKYIEEYNKENGKDQWSDTRIISAYKLAEDTLVWGDD